MNVGSDPIEKRSEVQFYDRYDLLGEGAVGQDIPEGTVLCCDCVLFFG